MKKIILLYGFVSVFILSCTNKKGEVPVPVSITSCITDTVIHIVPVVVVDNSFSPSSITIIVGDTVSWTYTGASAHTTTCNGATSGTTFPSGGTTWDSGVFFSGGSFKKAITVAGNYTYICTVHGVSMSGTIVVNPRCQ